MKFGESLPNRRALIQKLSKTTTDRTFPVDFQNDRKYLPVHSVSIEFPRYRLSNGRTGVDQLEYRAKHPNLPKDIFEKPESDEAQRHQHNILKPMLEERDLRSYFKNNKQLEPLILDSDGFVVNGNRRLCAMREYLQGKDKEKFKHFKNIEVVILPPSDKKAILELENKLQIQQDIKSDYKWYNTAFMFRSRLKEGMKSKDVEELYDVTTKEMTHRLAMFEEAERYLAARKKAGQFSTIPESRYAFDELVKALKTVDETKKDAFLSLAYVVIEKAEGRRAYEQIPKIARDIDKILPQVAGKAIKSDPSSKNKAAKKLLGSKGGATSKKITTLKLDTEKEKSKARQIILDTIGEQDSLRRENKKTDFVPGQLTKANECLKNALDKLSSAGDKKKLLPAVTKIEQTLDKLKRALKK